MEGHPYPRPRILGPIQVPSVPWFRGVVSPPVIELSVSVSDLHVIGSFLRFLFICLFERRRDCCTSSYVFPKKALHRISVSNFCFLRYEWGVLLGFYYSFCTLLKLNKENLIIERKMKSTEVLRSPPEWAKGPYKFVWNSLCRGRYFLVSEKARALLTSMQLPDMGILQNVLCGLSNLEVLDTSSTVLSKLFQRLFVRAEIRSFGSTIDAHQKGNLIALAALSAVAVSKHIVLTDRERLLEWLTEVLTPTKSY